MANLGELAVLTSLNISHPFTDIPLGAVVLVGSNSFVNIKV